MTVPTALERAGDFSKSVDNSGNPFPFIRDYTTNLPCSASNTTGCFKDGGVVGKIPANRLYGLGLKSGRPRTGFVAALVLATSLHFTWLARVGRIDMPLTLSVSVALAGFYLGTARWREEGRGCWGWFLTAYLAVAVGILLKGPIAAVLPAVVAASYLCLERRAANRQRIGAGLFRGAHTLGLWWGIPLVLATGPGTELRRPLGITIIGGLFVSQILTLYTTPVIYLLIDRLRRRSEPSPVSMPAE